MKRINGFLNIDGYFIKKYKKQCPDEYVKKINNRQFLITIDGEIYYFKKIENPYNELLAYEVAAFLGLNAVPYDLAIFKNFYGVISKDFKNPQYNYVSGQEILFEYASSAKNINNLKNMGLEQTENNQFPNDAPYSYNINNLSVIWQAIEQRYKKLGIYVDMEKIMNDLIIYFIFNILTLQNDGMAQNWVLEESKYGVNVSKSFDNELCFQINKDKNFPSLNLCTNFNDVGLGSYKILEEFLKISSQEYIDLFLEKFDMLNLDEFLKLINRVENKIECPIPLLIKDNYIKLFKENREKIELILNNLQCKKI